MTPAAPNRSGALRRAAAAAAAACALGTAIAAAAQTRIVVSGEPGRDRYKVAFPRPLGEAALAAEAHEVGTRDLEIAGIYQVLDPRGFLADLAREQLGVRPQDWINVGAQGVIKLRVATRGDQLTLDARFFEVAIRGAQPTLEKSYRGRRDALRDLVHRFCDDLHRHLTGEPGVARTGIAYARPGRSTQDIVVVDADGGRPRAVVHNGAHNLLPSWSPDGGSLLYTSLLWHNPDLFLHPLGGRARRLSRRPGLNSGGVLSPDGTRVALTLSVDGNAELYLVSAQTGAVLKRLTHDPAIDTSPSFSPDGSQLAFVSSRHGTPQVWVMSAEGGGARRVTFQGNYNQAPRFSPRRDARRLAFTGRDEHGRFDVFVLDLDSGQTTRVTQNQGDNWEPTWAPHGRLLAFKSSRDGGGLWVATPDGSHQVRIVSGAVETPAWGPLPSD